MKLRRWPPASSPARQDYRLAIVFVTVLVDMLGYGMIVPLLPLYVQRQAGGAFLAGSLGSVYALMQLISGPILGSLSDRFGRRPVLLGCLVGTAGAFALLGLADSLGLIFVAIVLDGLTGGNLTTAYAYIADVTEPANRSRAMGLVGAAFGLGLVGGPALGGLLSAGGLSAPAFLAAGIALSNALFGVFLLPESLPPERRAPDLFRLRELRPFAALRDVYRLSGVRLLLLIIFLQNLAFSGLQTNFPLFSQARFAWNSLQTGVFYAFVGGCAVFVQAILYGWIQPRFGERRLTITGLALMASGLAGVALISQSWMLYPVIGVVALGSGLSIPSLTGLLSGRVEPGRQGRLMGGVQTLLSLTMILGPALAGLAFERVAITAPYWLGSLLAFGALGAALASFTRRSPTDRDEREPVTTSGG